MARSVLVPRDRVDRWCRNFQDRHGSVVYSVVDGSLHGVAEDGSSAVLSLPFDRRYDGPPEPTSFADDVRAPERWGLLLVRKGGFAVARLEGPDLREHKIGQRHVQARTKAGGQSQQRFARRRDNQAKAAFDAAADHAVRVLAGGVEALVTGGDRPAVAAVLSDPRLTGPAATQVGRWLAVPDPRRAVLDRAIVDACAAEVLVDDTETRGS